MAEAAGGGERPRGAAEGGVGEASGKGRGGRFGAVEEMEEAAPDEEEEEEEREGDGDGCQRREEAVS